jgi:NhaP-type Na+/H+ or K+/H+ antiporter
VRQGAPSARRRRCGRAQCPARVIAGPRFACRFNDGVTEVEVFVFLLLAVAVLAGLGLRTGVPYPVALVLGGLVIGLVPGLPSPALDPDVVFVFLPPLLYAAAVTASAQELRAN